MREDLARLLQVRSGHYEFESGHHGERWFDLELLFRRPEGVEPLAAELAERLRPYRVEAVCGPLVEGAFLALQVAHELRVDFTYTERHVEGDATGLFPVRYRVPAVVRRLVEGRRVAIVNDVINAGSAVGGTLEDLRSCPSEVVAIASLLALGPRAQEMARDAGVPLEVLDTEANVIWEPRECPLCRAGTPLIPHPGS